MIKNYSLENIRHNPFQARQLEDPQHIRELAEDILANGLLQIPEGRPDPADGNYAQLAMGSERLAAFCMLADGVISGADCREWKEMPVDVRELTDRQMFEHGIAENLKRRPLSAIETGAAMRCYADTFHATWTEVGKLFGYTQSAVSNLVRLQNLPEPVKAMVENHRLAERQARQLLAVERIDGTKAAAIAETVAAAPVPERDRVLHREIDRVLRGKDSRDLDDADGEQFFPPAWSDVSADIPSCEDCPMRIGNDTCVRPDCWERKREHWVGLRLQETAAKTGIPAPQLGEAVKSIPMNYQFGNQIEKAISKKLPHLRWMVVKDNDPAHGDYCRQTGSYCLALATTDLKAWEEYLEEAAKAHRKTETEAAKAEAADDPKARAKYEKAVQQMREEKGRVIRNRYDVNWIIRSGTDAIAAKLDVHGAAALYLADRTTEEWWAGTGSGEDVDELAEAIEEQRKAAKTEAEKERQARRQFALYLFTDYRRWVTVDRKDTEKSFVDLAAGVGVRLPKDWNQPPIHHTEHNCWHCGRFGSTEGHLLKAEIEDGWGTLAQGGKMLDVHCPDCVKKTRKVEPLQSEKKKSKHKK